LINPYSRNESKQQDKNNNADWIKLKDNHISAELIML
jgi:hypothetical protein